MMEEYSDDLVYWMWLNAAFGPANPRKWQAYDRFASVRSCYEAITAGDLYGLTEQERKGVLSATLEQAEGVLHACEKKQIGVCGFDSPEYPDILRSIYNPPAVLFYLGDISCLNDSVSVGIVGARKMTDYTERVTRCISAQLAESGITVVSGFANGVDRAAHMGAVGAGGKTVAVLGCGVEYDYPKDSGELKQTVAGHGAVISEYYPAAAPTQLSFRARNRILSGVSRGILITQASKTSGSLNTASNALSQGRDLFCVPPHDVFSSVYAGVSDLLRDGAIPVFSHRDILYEYYADYSHKLKFTRDLDAFGGRSGSSMMFASDIPPEKGAGGKRSGASGKKAPSGRSAGSRDSAKKDSSSSSGRIALSKERYELLDGLHKRIIDELSEADMLADELAARLEIEVSDLFSELTALEIEGLVKSMAGNRFGLV